MRQILKQFIFLVCIILVLTGCNDTTVSSGNRVNTVNASAPQNTYVTTVGHGVTVPVTFTASSGQVTNLTVTNLSALPASWSVQGNVNTFSCATVTASGNGCQMQLTFAPVQANRDNGVLKLNYSYLNAAGQNQTGQISISYAVLNTVISAVNSTLPIKTVIDSNQNVFVVFAAMPSATTATDLKITSDLSQLPSGWSVMGGNQAFSCSNVQGQNACQLGLNFEPKESAQTGTLMLNYTYRDNSGVLQQDSVAVPYVATSHNTIQGVSDSIPISAAVNSSKMVTVTYTTSDGLAASNFKITSDLGGLQALGWTGPANFNCDSVTQTNGCQLLLTFQPTNYNQDGTLQLTYSYDDNSGSPQNGITIIPYSATSIDTVQISTSPPSPITTYVNQSIPVVITFTTNDGQPATDLEITTGLTSLSDGWTQISGTPGSFSCATVDGGTTSCQLSLKYAPTSDTSSGGTLVLNYDYNDNSGTPKKGSINLPYSATPENNVNYSTSPNAPLAVAANSSQPVKVDFITDNESATEFSIGLTDFSADNPGWTWTNNPQNNTSFTCATVNMTSGDCELDLTYAPTTKQDLSSLSLPYSYKANDGNTKSGTFTYQYSTGTNNNTVNATANPSSVTGVTVGSSNTVIVNFNTSDSHTASKLSMDLSLPADWSASPTTSPFRCNTVPASGTSGCSLILTYQPSLVTSGTSLVLPYTYTSNNGEPGNGNLSIAYSAAAPVYTVLHSFRRNDGGNPVAGLVAASDGNFYGTTYSGGTSNVGTVYKITPAGTETVLYSFAGGSDGANPYAGLVAASDGNFYGTTYFGGASVRGTVYKITPAGTETVLYSFKGKDVSDGSKPQAGLVAASDGNFYGTTYFGGAALGTVYRLSISVGK